MKKYGFNFEWEEIEDKIELPRIIVNLEKWKDKPQSFDFKYYFSCLRSFYHEYLNGNPLSMKKDTMEEIYNKYEPIFKGRK